MNHNMKNKTVSDNYKSGIEIRSDLERLNNIKKAIEEIIDKMETYELKTQSEITNLKDKIYKLTTKDSYLNDYESQELVKKINEKIESKESLLLKRKKVLINQLKNFKSAYNELYSKEIKLRCGDLKEELRKSGKEIFVNLSVGIVSYEHTELSNIINEYQDKNCCIDMCISDRKNPEYYKMLNNILYAKRFPVDFDEIQYDGEILSNHLTLGYGLTDDPKRYTYLEIKDPSNINLKFRLGELTKEEEDWRPVKLIRETVCNCKDREYNKNKEKLKRI